MLLVALLISPAGGWSLNVSPGNVSGNGGTTITVPINISDVGAGLNADAFGFTIAFDSSVLTFVEAKKDGTLTAPFTLVSGNVIAPGQVKVNGSLFGTPVNIAAAGVFVNLSFTVNSAAYKDSTLALSAFKDDISTATTTNGTFSITGVTRSVVVTPASTTTIVAGQPVTLTAEVLINGTHLDLTSPADVTFAASGRGAFGASSLSAGKVQVVYTTHTKVESSTITATEKITGSNSQGTAEVTSVAGPLVTLTVAPDTKTLDADKTEQFAVTGVDANGNAADMGTITWTVQGGIGTITNTGLFSANVAGTGTVTATSNVGNVSDASGTITVIPGNLVSIAVSPDTKTLTADQAEQFSVVGKDADNNAITNLGAVNWSVQGGIGTIDGNGLFTATTVGTGTVTATAGGKTDVSGTITVTHGAAAKMTITASGTTLASDQKGNAMVNARILDLDGNPCDTDNGRAVNFSLTDSTYLTLSAAAANTVNGVATISVQTKAGQVASPPATAGLNITSAGLTPPAATPDLTFTIVNFSATPQDRALLTTGSPHSTTITAIGATSYNWSVQSGKGTLSATTGSSVTLTAPNSITEGTAGHPTVVRVQDATNTTVQYDLTIRTYEPVSVTQPASAVGITSSGTPKTIQLQVAGGSGAYSYAVNGAAGVIDVSPTGLVTGLANGTRTVYVWDTANGAQATANNFRASTPNIEVVSPVTVTPATATLKAAATQQFAAAGGKGSYVWSTSNGLAGSISAAGLFTAAQVTAPQTTTITATDGTYGNIKGTATVSVLPPVAISNAPTTTPTVTSGKEYATVLQASGGSGSGNYEWKVTTDPSGTFSTNWTTQDTFAFIAPKTTNSGGLYEITLRDKLNPTFTSTFQIKVSIALDPSSFNFLSGGAEQTFTVAGTAAANKFTWDILSDTTMAKVTDTTVYGSWNPASVVTGALTNKFTPATVTAMKTFYLQITVEGDADLTEANGLNKAVFGPFRILPTADYTVNVKDGAGAPLAAATVTVNHPANTWSAPNSAAAGKFVFKLPDTGGKYLYRIALAGYLPNPLEVSSAAKTIDAQILVVDAAKAIKGTVTPSPATAGATVTAYLPTAAAAQIPVQYTATTANDGTYTIDLPAGAAATGWTVVPGKTGYQSATPLTGVAAGATGVNFVLTGVTGVAPDAGTGGGGLTPPPANGQMASVQVPAGGLTADGYIRIVQENKDLTTSNYTAASPTYVYDVKIYTDAAFTTPMPEGNIKRVVITVPLDLGKVKPGDLESGAFRIYSAPTKALLEAGSGTAVPISNIISTDYVGNGMIGSVTFWVDHLSFFGIGGGSGIGGGDDGGSGCFIATAAYGSYFEPHVMLLRHFRDAYLLTNDWGRAFVAFYYRHSPALAGFIAKHDGLRAVVRLGLAPLVGVAYVTIHTTPLQKALIGLALIGLLTAGTVVLLRTRRVRRGAV
jgi:hypothetical protein